MREVLDSYGVEFPVMETVNVVDTDEEQAHDCYKFIRSKAKGRKVEWNFEKYIINDQGKLVYGVDCYRLSHELAPIIDKIIAGKSRSVTKQLDQKSEEESKLVQPPQIQAEDSK